MTTNDFDNLDWPSPPAPPADVSESIRRTCTQALTPRQALNSKKKLLGSIGLSATLFAVLLTVGWMRHPPKAAIFIALLGALAWGLVQALVLCVGVGRPPGRRCSCTLRRATVFVVLSLFIAHLLFSTTSILSFEQFLSVPRALRGTVVCGVHAVIFGALATTLLFVLWRRTDPFRPRLTGALMGLAGGLVGAVALDMTCTCFEGWHLILSHGITLALLVAGGWFAGGKWLPP